MPRVLHWFRNDLRHLDNPALHAAAERSQGELITCFIATPLQWERHDEAPLKLDFLIRNLDALAQALQVRHIPLLRLECADFEAQLPMIEQLLDLLQCRTLTFNEEYGVNERRRDRELTRCLSARGITVLRYRDQSITPAGSVLTEQGNPYSVFSPFKRRWWQSPDVHDTTPFPAPPLQGPPHLPDLTRDLAPPGCLRPDATISTNWEAGEDAAHHHLEAFCEDRVAQYAHQRDFPAIDGTSQLSPYLAIGVLSGRQCLRAARHRQAHDSQANQGIESWINELIWRDFYIHILYHFPRVSMHRAFRVETEALPWQGEGAAFTAWCNGRTGIPIVDAAMRQLNQTGWMHNRLRMICAMFLTKNLFVDWRLGERYFMQHLIDGYLPANNGGWQWSASTGTDAAPYFRVFNPVSQSQKFDPDGRFLRHFLPEIARRDDRTIHLPLESPLRGIDYPIAIVDLKQSRAEAIARFKALSDRPDTPDSPSDASTRKTGTRRSPR